MASHYSGRAPAALCAPAGPFIVTCCGWPAISHQADAVLDKERQEAKARLSTSTGGVNPQPRQKIAEAENGRALDAVPDATAIKAKAMLLLAEFVDAGQADGTIRTKDAGRPISVESLHTYSLPDRGPSAVNAQSVRKYSIPELLGTEDRQKADHAVRAARSLRDALGGADGVAGLL